MDYSKYIDLIYQGKNNEALELKNSYVPSVLYKYYSLDRRTKLNELKLQCLREGKIYLSSLNEFNDPFEGKFMIFDNDKLAEAGWTRKIVDMYYNNAANQFKVGCLSGTNEHNMPMWAYYANNHEGYCVEYHLTNEQKKYIFPVAYDKERVHGNSIVTHIINGIQNMADKKIKPDDMPKELQVYQQLVFLSLTTKHESWSHEKEYRIMNPFDNYFPVVPRKIFIGMKCKAKNKTKLEEIGNRFNGYCEVYQMEMARDTEAFELIRK